MYINTFVHTLQKVTWYDYTFFIMMKLKGLHFFWKPGLTESLPYGTQQISRSNEFQWSRTCRWRRAWWRWRIVRARLPVRARQQPGHAGGTNMTMECNGSNSKPIFFHDFGGWISKFPSWAIWEFTCQNSDQSPNGPWFLSIPCGSHGEGLRVCVPQGNIMLFDAIWCHLQFAQGHSWPLKDAFVFGVEWFNFWNSIRFWMIGEGVHLITSQHTICCSWEALGL